MWYVGVLINVVGSLSINLSTNVIKLAHKRLEELSEHVPDDDDTDDCHEIGGNLRGEKGRSTPAIRRPPWYHLRHGPNRLWLAAMIVFVLANLANFASFAFAAQSLLAALGSIQFVSNVAFARIVNKERITPQTVIGTIVIVAGCVVLVLFGSHDSPSYTVDELLALYGNAGYIVYLCIGAVVSMLSYATYWWIKRTKGSRTLSLYVVFSAVIGTQSVLYGKSLSLLFRAAVHGTNVAKEWYSWMCLLAFLATAFFWVRRFNQGLRNFDVMTSMPAMQVGWILFSLISGGLYFEEFRGFNGLQWGMFSLGVLGVVSGVCIVCLGPGSRPWRRGTVRRVSTLYDTVGLEWEDPPRAENQRRCVTAYCSTAPLHAPVRCRSPLGGTSDDLEAALRRMSTLRRTRTTPV